MVRFRVMPHQKQQIKADADTCNMDISEFMLECYEKHGKPLAEALRRKEQETISKIQSPELSKQKIIKWLNEEI